jgi:mono/diheme cytochrome c family protein
MRVAADRAALWAALGGLAAAMAVGATGERTVWDGVYTEQQAERGAAAYAEHCADCHGSLLEGIEAAPTLTGAAFYGKWDGETLAALVERIRVSMPPNAPGSVARAQIVDILAHVLRVGGYPAGDSPLDAQAGTLAAISVQIYKQ